MSRQRYVVTSNITVTAESAEEAGQLVDALLAPLVFVAPFSGKFPPEVIGVQAKDLATLNVAEQQAWIDLMGKLGIEEP